jgi:hypothetical protein
LRRRLGRTRWHDQTRGDPWALGVSVEWMRELSDYWRHDFDWREQAALNAFPQFRVELHGIPLLFVHQPGKGPAPLPLLLNLDSPMSSARWCAGGDARMPL